MKDEALKLSDELLRDNTQLTVESAYMIRRLVEELDKQTYKADLLENRLKVLVGTKPLSPNEIIQIYSQIDGRGIINLVRAVEERHGIK